MELEAEEILKEADTSDVAFLVVGDPFGWVLVLVVGDPFGWVLVLVLGDP